MAEIDTIYALSTPPGRGGIAVIRVSGPKAWDSLSRLSAVTAKEPPARYATHRTLYHPKDKTILDHAMVIGFKAPKSFTGEDTIEYHLHGGLSVVEGVLSALSNLEGMRLALPGEFTRRAFENDKMDLTSAEAIADLIHAETEQQRHQALRQMNGALASLYEKWKDRVAHDLALMEADLDFSDQDLPEDILLKVRPDLSGVLSEIEEHLNDNRRGEILRNGVRLVILGAPNAGKSSLTNALTQRDVAIVSSVAGTTRDIIETHLNIGGYPVILSDTAGLRPEQLGSSDHDHIESEGIKRALKKAEEADIKILLFDGTIDPDPHTLNLVDENSILVRNKTDLGNTSQISKDMISISAKTGGGIENLLRALTDVIKQKLGADQFAGNTPSLTRQRHRAALEKTVAALKRSITAPLPELAAEDLRLSIRHLGSLTGRVDVEDILDMIFRDFCIGK